MSKKPTYEQLVQRVKDLEREYVENKQPTGSLNESSERKWALKEIEDSYHLLQTVIDTIEGEVFVKDSKGKYLFVNRAFANDFGVDSKEVIGKDDYSVFSHDTAAILQENDRRILAAKRAENIEESTILHGEHVTYLTNKVPLIGDDGNVLGICGVGFDITRQKEMEQELKNAQFNLEEQVKERTSQLTKTIEQLQEAEWRYRTVADFTYDWEYWTNLDGTLRYVSPSCERISGYTSKQFMDNPSLYREIIIREDQNVWKKHFHDSRKKPKAREIQFRIRHRDGSIRWIEHACQPVRGDQAAVLGFRASNRDITNRKDRELKLQKTYSEIKKLKKQLEADRTYLLDEIRLSHDHGNIIGNSDVLKYVLFRAEQIAPTDTTVLILGETGTGKELIARAIYNSSNRKDRPLIKVDCASLSVNLIESELFGHEKGAFTHAVEQRVGRFELANGATIFLDEIGELPLELQSKLLRVLQSGEFERLGSSKTHHTDVRVIAATNRDLEKDVQNKHFRMDLWYRLNVFAISIPPLRKRTEDIDLLVNFLVKKFTRKLGKQIRSISTDVISKLKSYSWPGNVRELENIIERAVIYTRGDTLQLEDVLDAKQPDDASTPAPVIKSLEVVQREHILMVLKKTNWKIHGKDGAAALLAINPSTLRGRMRKQAIQRPPYKT